MKMRRENPELNLSYDGEFLAAAAAHAVKRLVMKPEESLTLLVSSFCPMQR